VSFRDYLTEGLSVQIISKDSYGTVIASVNGVRYQYVVDTAIYPELERLDKGKRRKPVLDKLKEYSTSTQQI